MQRQIVVLAIFVLNQQKHHPRQNCISQERVILYEIFSDTVLQNQSYILLKTLNKITILRFYVKHVYYWGY